MSVNQNNNLTSASVAWGIQNNNNFVNEVFTRLTGVTVISDINELSQIMHEPFDNSIMSKGSVIGGGYQLGMVELHRDQAYLNKAHILDSFTLNNLSQSSLEHLYLTNAIYATSKSIVIEKANKIAKENHYDEVLFADTNKAYSMNEAEFDFFFKGKKMATHIVKADTDKIIECKKENIRGFIGYDVDIDNVDYERACNLCTDIENGVIPMPTIIVVTGTGVHLKYLFISPVYFRNQVALEKHEKMQGFFSRIFTHDDRYCGKEQETGSYQRDLPIGQPMRAIGNIYDKIEDCKITTEGYTSGIYYDMNELNQWTNVPDMKVAKVASSLEYNRLKARRLSQLEYTRLYDSFVEEGIGYRTSHRNLLFHHMLVEGDMSFDEALSQINNMVNELNEKYPVPGNPVRLLTRAEAKRFDPTSETFDYNYYVNNLSTSAMVDTHIYHVHIKREQYHTGLSQRENLIQVRKTTVQGIEKMTERILYCLLNTAKGTRDNRTGIVEYNGEQCIVGGFDFTPFVMQHSPEYTIHTDTKYRSVRDAYRIIDNPEDEYSKMVLTRVFDYLNGSTIQRAGSTNIFSKQQEFIHHFLLESTPQEYRDQLYAQYLNPCRMSSKKYSVLDEGMYREINRLLNLFKSLTHHHYEKIRPDVVATQPYITGDVLAENWIKTDEAINRLSKTLMQINIVREEVLKQGTHPEVIAEINKTNEKQLAFTSTREAILLESQQRRFDLMAICFADKTLDIPERLRRYQDVINTLTSNQRLSLNLDNVFNIWTGINLLNKQARQNEELFRQEMAKAYIGLETNLETIQRVDRAVVNFINQTKEGNKKYHGTFMYVCYLRGFLGFLDHMLAYMPFPYNKVGQCNGLDYTQVGAVLNTFDNTHKEMYQYNAYNPRTGEVHTYKQLLTAREYVAKMAMYYNFVSCQNNLEQAVHSYNNLRNECQHEDDRVTG